MLFGKKFIRGLLTKLSRRQSTIVSIEELCELVKDRRSLDETIVRLSKENEILRERVSVLQDIVESHKYENFDKMGKESGAVLPLGNKGDTDSLWLQDPCVIFVNGMYKMWYSGNNDYRWRIHYATSTDGKNWIYHGDVSQFLPKHIGEIYDIKTPCIIKDGDVYKAWFSGRVDDKWRIYYTVLSESSITK